MLGPRLAGLSEGQFSNMLRPSKTTALLRRPETGHSIKPRPHISAIAKEAKRELNQRLRRLAELFPLLEPDSSKRRAPLPLSTRLEALRQPRRGYEDPFPFGLKPVEPLGAPKTVKAVDTPKTAANKQAEELCKKMEPTQEHDQLPALEEHSKAPTHESKAHAPHAERSLPPAHECKADAQHELHTRPPAHESKADAPHEKDEEAESVDYGDSFHEDSSVLVEEQGPSTQLDQELLSTHESKADAPHAE